MLQFKIHWKCDTLKIMRYNIHKFNSAASVHGFVVY